LAKLLTFSSTHPSSPHSHMIWRCTPCIILLALGIITENLTDKTEHLGIHYDDAIINITNNVTQQCFHFCTEWRNRDQWRAILYHNLLLQLHIYYHPNIIHP
jgi:hypothetical protein